MAADTPTYRNIGGKLVPSKHIPEGEKVPEGGEGDSVSVPRPKFDAMEAVIEAAENMADGLSIGKPYREAREQLLLSLVLYRAASGDTRKEDSAEKKKARR